MRVSGVVVAALAALYMVYQLGYQAGYVNATFDAISSEIKAFTGFTRENGHDSQPSTEAHPGPSRGTVPGSGVGR